MWLIEAARLFHVKRHTRVPEPADSLLHDAFACLGRSILAIRTRTRPWRRPGSGRG